MKERPILFSSAMVGAILDGRKIQTRRVVKPQPVLMKARGRQIIGDEFHEWPAGIIRRKSVLAHDMVSKCPYGQPKDHLWVRETWKCAWTLQHGHGLYFRMVTITVWNPGALPSSCPAGPHASRWRSSMSASNECRRSTRMTPNG